jgi:hypothetical protein
MRSEPRCMPSGQTEHERSRQAVLCGAKPGCLLSASPHESGQRLVLPQRGNVLQRGRLGNGANELVDPP